MSELSDLLSNSFVFFGRRINALINKLEIVQRNLTKKLFDLEHFTYNDRLHVINAATLEIWRIKAILLLYIFHKVVDSEEDDFIIRNNSNTRCFNFKITKQLSKSNVCMIFF